ncbi:MAG: hypothetical protein J6Q14_08695 [Oscillospiraceae bacterium]|nr:hypothetical protein [Oscillospiraceae bacterium]
MPNDKELYFKLFSAVADATEYLEQENNGLARQRLVAAQKEAEEQFLGQEE